MEVYLTLGKSAEAEYEIQKSRFIGQAAPVPDLEAALTFLQMIRQTHKGASHHCYAYVIGRNRNIIRYGDDGEPSGTAGKPIAEVMLQKKVVNCAVVITRYFGGVLLGAGGLMRAYTHTAALALNAAGICAMQETRRWAFTFAYPQWDKADHVLHTLPVTLEHTEFRENVVVVLLVRTADEDWVHAELTRCTDGKMTARKEDPPYYYPWEIE